MVTMKMMTIVMTMSIAAIRMRMTLTMTVTEKMTVTVTVKVKVKVTATEKVTVSMTMKVKVKVKVKMKVKVKVKVKGQSEVDSKFGTKWHPIIHSSICTFWSSCMILCWKCRNLSFTLAFRPVKVWAASCTTRRISSSSVFLPWKIKRAKLLC